MRAPARLNAELLARKGQALPTSGFAYTSIAHDEPLRALERPALLRPSTAVAAVASRHDARTACRHQPGPAAGRREADRVALTLRLDRERHRRLRIVGARHECSSQAVIVRALDAYLATCGDRCACLRGETEDCVRN